MGPGTHIVARIHEGIQPTGQNDAASLIHDVEYLRYRDQSIPDKTAVSNAGLLAIPMKIAFSIKQLFGNIGEVNQQQYWKLRNVVDNDPRYEGLAKYDMYWSDGKPVRPNQRKHDSQRG